MLSSDWPRKYDIARPNAQYDARVFEVTREKTLAFELLISGPSCTDTACEDRSPDGMTPSGWSMYSAERFFFMPLVHGVHCADDALLFSTQNVLKVARYTAGAVSVRAADGEVLQSAAFEWEPYWMKTQVEVALAPGAARRAVELVVANEWGDETRVAFQCS